MLVTNATLQALRTGFNKRFQQGRDAARGKAKAAVMATRVSSSTKTETYGFLSEMPAFREWVGDKRAKDLKEFAYQLLNRAFEATVYIHKHKIADDNLGLYGPMIEGWGGEAELFPDRLLFEALSKGHQLPCFDNQNFFDASHPNYDEAGTTFSNIDTTGAVNPWYLLDLSKPLKPLIMQDREAPHFWMITDVQDSRVADTGEFGAYAEARGAAGFTLPSLAYRSTATLNETNFVAARDAMAAWKDRNGDPRGIVPTHLVHGVSNRAAAENLIKKMNLAGGESNIHWNEVELLFAERLP